MDMATATVSASVNADVKRIVGNRLREQGTTANEVIRNLWEHIAATGEIPTFEAPERTGDVEDPAALRRLMKLREDVPLGTPLASLDSAGLRRELEERDA